MSYRSGDLSQVYPLFPRLAPVLVVIGAVDNGRRNFLAGSDAVVSPWSASA